MDLSLSWFFSITCCCNGLYFLLPETERKCFLEEIPDETTVVGKYKIEQVDPNNFNVAQIQGKQVSGMHVEVKDPEQHVMMSRAYGDEGKFSFTSNMPGDHMICLWTNSTRWFGGSLLRIHFNISVGEHANDYSEIAATGKLTEIQLRVRQLMDQLRQIAKEQHYQRVREERFRQISESTNSRVLLWAMFQMGVLLAICFWQMSHLKGFFEAKKVV